MPPLDKRVEAPGRWLQKDMEIFCGPQLYPTIILAHWWVTKEEPTCSCIPKVMKMLSLVLRRKVTGSEVGYRGPNLALDLKHSNLFTSFKF